MNIYIYITIQHHNIQIIIVDYISPWILNTSRLYQQTHLGYWGNQKCRFWKYVQFDLDNIFL